MREVHKKGARPPVGILLATVALCAALSARSEEPPDAPANVNLSQMTLGYTYYNRPGADLAKHSEDVRECAVTAGAMHSTAEYYGSLGLAYLRYNGVVGRADPTDRSLAAASLENCMVVRGWRVVQLPDEEGKTLAGLPPGQLSDKLTPWIAAADPHGRIVRIWDNDAAKGATHRYSSSPRMTKGGQLSLLVGAPELKELPSAPISAPASPWILPRWQLPPLKPGELGKIPAGGALIIVQVKGAGMTAGLEIEFNREGNSKDSLPSDIDHATSFIGAGTGWLFAHPRGGDIYAFAVPVGRWRIYGVGGMPTLNFCLGSPSFEVKAGEIVYAGSFDLSANVFEPNMDLAPAKGWLADPSRTVLAASYVNGSQGRCSNNTIYALEINGAPFEPGYGWGSRAVVRSPESGSASTSVPK